MEFLHSKKFPTNSGRRGFALVATLSLLVLLIVIAVGLLSLASISLRSGSADSHQAEARANARMALILAIGELQKEMGSDQRITARAEILDEDTETPAADGIANPHWMGTWNAWDDWLNNPAIASTYDKGRSTNFRRWLISHPEPTQLTDLTLPATGLTSPSVTLASAGSEVGRGFSPAEVRVPTVATPGGRYGWWVTGENQKALIAADGEQPAAVDRLHARSQWPGAAAESLAGMESASSDSNVIDRLASLATYGLSGTDPAAMAGQLKSRFHDLTVDSLGLCANVRKGGLKKDLNLLLEMPRLPAEFGTFSSSDFNGSIVPIRKHDGYLPSPYYSQGLNFTSWYKLHQYYQLYRGGGDESAADCTPVPFKGAGVWGAADAPQINFNWHRQNLDYYGTGRTPIVSRLMLVFSTRRVKSSNGVNYDYKLGVNPVVVLWNPYNVTLHSPRLWIQITPGAMQYKAYVDGVETVPWKASPVLINIYPMEAPNAKTQPIILKPGETRIYSAVTGMVSSGSNFELYPGYQPADQGGGFDIPLTGLSNLPGSPKVELAMRMTDTRTDHGGQYQMYWTVRNAQTGESQRYNEMAANPVETDAVTGLPKPIYLANDIPGERVVFSNSPNRVPFSNFQFALKSGEDLRNPGENASGDDFRCRNFIHANPANQRAMYGEATRRMRGMSQYHVQVESGSGNSLNPDFESATNRSYLGSAISLGNSTWPGQTNVVTNELPVMPVTSLASLMHFKLNPGDTRVFSTGRHLWDVSANQALGIGGSFAHPLIAGNAIYQDVPDASCRGSAIQMKLIRDFHDHAYLNNDALWDDWFFSGITLENQGLYKTGRSIKKVVEDFEKNGGGLRNPHLIPWTESLPADKSLTDLLTTTNGDLPSDEGWKLAARHLLLKGAFNVNSTSIEAWKALLSGLRDEEITYIDHNSGEIDTTSAPQGRVVLSRFSLPASPDEGTNAGDPASWLGIRKLTPEQIDRLARECVRQIKERGPFLNLSDFINRRLADDETGVCGALQAAIDWDEFLGRSPAADDAESINGRFKQGDDMIKAAAVGNWNLPFPKAATGSRFAGIPGYVTQADVLKRIGNMISVRDDTFRIRAYGEATDTNGKVQSRAWCEAVVQRTPDYTDPTDAPELSHTALTIAGNKAFGRRFRIVSFRWLSPDEI